MPYIEAVALSALLTIWVLFVFFSSYIHWLPYRNDRGRFVKIWLPTLLTLAIYGYADFPNNSWSKQLLVAFELVEAPCVLTGMIVMSVTAIRRLDSSRTVPRTTHAMYHSQAIEGVSARPQISVTTKLFGKKFTRDVLLIGVAICLLSVALFKYFGYGLFTVCILMIGIGMVTGPLVDIALQRKDREPHKSNIPDRRQIPRQPMLIAHVLVGSALLLIGAGTVLFSLVVIVEEIGILTNLVRSHDSTFTNVTTLVVFSLLFLGSVSMTAYGIWLACSSGGMWWPKHTVSRHTALQRNASAIADPSEIVPPNSEEATSRECHHQRRRQRNHRA